jgi:hypothetical protein
VSRISFITVQNCPEITFPRKTVANWVVEKMRAFGAILFLLNLGLLVQALAPQQEVLPVRSQDSFCPGKLLIIYLKYITSKTVPSYKS